MRVRPALSGLALVALLAPAACDEELVPRRCAENADCVRQICVAEVCTSVGCQTASDCPNGVCDLNQCVPRACERDADCGGAGLVCVVGVCRPPDGGYIAPPPAPELGPPPELGPGDPEPGTEAGVRDLAPPPVDLGPPADQGAADPVLGRYALELSFAEGDCPVQLNGEADQLLVLELSARNPLRGTLEGVTRDAVRVVGDLNGANLTLNSPSPARVDEICQIDIDLTITGTTTPGGMVGDVQWALSEREPCDLVDLSTGCARRDTFVGRRADR